MFISRLEMIGFKSFAAKTTLDFRPGVMAVVGPNGCGKTNIVDAIRWVLGEQRTSTIRADRMESVIFNGTPQRRPLGMAEVTLTIENDKGILPSSYTQVAITRRLFRSGESEYLINRNPCRLRDISDLFADTGLGSNAYSIIELSMVEGIITGSSDSRRALLEEAAGVAKYKTRRAAAQRRLAQTRENLDRVEDIYREVEKTYNALRRQAARARRYQKLTRALQLKLIADLSEERLDIIFKRKPLEERLARIEEEHQQAENDATQATSELLSLEGRELSLLDRSKRTQDALKRLESRETELKGELALTKQRITFLETQQEKANDRKSELNETIKTSEEQSSVTETERQNLESELEVKETEAARIEKQIEDLSVDLEKLREEVSHARQAETEIRSFLNSEQEHFRRIEDDRNLLTARQKRLHNEKTELEDAINSLDVEVKKLLKDKGDNDQKRTDVEKQYELIKPELDEIRLKRDEALSQRARASAKFEAAKASLNSHRKIPSSPSGLPKNMRAIADRENLLSLGSRLECDKRFEKALAAALNSILPALDRKDCAEAVGLVSNVEDKFQLVLRTANARPFGKTELHFPANAKDCVRACELIDNKGELGEFLKGRLQNVVIVPDIDTLSGLMSWANDENVYLITTDGILYEPDGVLHSARLSAESVAVGWTTRLNELQKDVEDAQGELGNAEKDLENLNIKFRELQLRAEEIRISRQEFRNNTARLERSYEDRKATLERKQRQLKETLATLDQITKDLSGLGQVEMDIDPDLERDLEEKTRIRSDIEKTLLEAEGKYRELTARQSAIKTEIARLTERIASARRNLDRFKSEQEQAVENLAKFNAVLTEGETELKRVSSAAESLTGQIELIDREKADVIVQVDQVRTERSGLREERDKSTLRLNNAQERQKDALKERNKVEADVITLRERLREVDRRLTEDADVHPSSVTEKTPIEAQAELEVLEMGDIPIDKLKIRLQALGPVNMLALDELDGVEERYKFLIDQKKDLLDGIELIEETIDQINHEARRRFRETFARVDEYFQDVFRNLFEGGEARITLQDGDPLEADIRIWATPSGKKLQALSMLSGGEKALTAIALLFAIYRVRPSPFCILDEVDAPLDDSNVARYNKLIRDYSENTQFMIVTHNKRSMEASDCLFGVTLGDNGTSRLLTVKIESGKGEAELVTENKDAKA